MTDIQLKSIKTIDTKPHFKLSGNQAYYLPPPAATPNGGQYNQAYSGEGDGIPQVRAYATVYIQNDKSTAFCFYPI